MAFSPDGKHLACAGGTQIGGEVKVYNVQTGQELHSLKGHTDGVRDVAFSSDGKRLASASWDGTVKVWDALTGQELLTLPIGADAGSVAFSPDGHRLASGRRDGTVMIWDATPLPEKP